MRDILQLLATHPLTPPDVLEHLVTFTATRGPALLRRSMELREKLAANPNVTPAQMRALMELHASARTRILHATFNRPGITATDVVTLLDGDTTSTMLTHAVKYFPDPDGTLARHAFTHGTGSALWIALLSNDATPTDVRYGAAWALATASDSVSSAGAHQIRRVAQRRLRYTRTPNEHALALAWVNDLCRAVTDARLAANLNQLDLTYTPPQVGSTTWLTDPEVRTDDVIHWATSGPHTRAKADAFAAAVRSHPDPTGVLAEAAMALPGTHKAVLRAVLASPTAPAPLRHHAATHLWPLDAAFVESHTLDLLRAADHKTAVKHVTHPLAAHHWLNTVLGRADLTSTDLDLLLAKAATGNADGILREWQGMWIATHPHATPEQRVRGLHLAELHGLRGPGLAIAQAAQDIATDGPADVGLRVQLSALNHWEISHCVGVPWLLGCALGAHLAAGRLGQHGASVLTALADSFPGTLGELLATTHAITQ